MKCFHVVYIVQIINGKYKTVSKRQDYDIVAQRKILTLSNQ